MSYTERFSEGHAILGMLAPSAANAAVGQHNTAWASVQTYNRVFVLATVAAPAGASTFNLRLRQASDDGGTGEKNIVPQPAGAGVKAITELAAADAGAYVGIELRTEEMDVDGGFDHVQAQAIVGVAAYYSSVFVFGLEPRYAPVGVTAWEEIVA